MKAEQLLTTAAETIGNRGQAYGGRENSLLVIADFWSVWLSRRLGFRVVLNPTDAAMMMALMKVARISGNLQHEDSYVDLAGYTALAAEIGLETITAAGSSGVVKAARGMQTK